LLHNTENSFHNPVIAITGSNGKTIVKEWLYHLLQPFANIVRSPRSFNSQLGVPLSIWQMGPQHQMAVIEAGISEKGEMSKLSDVIQPTVGLLTNLGAAHAEGFASDVEKLEEKAKLFASVKQLIYCKDHSHIDKYISDQSFFCKGQTADQLGVRFLGRYSSETKFNNFLTAPC